uniref:DNA (cytosine-5-)-methyltransferase n=1 Tax=Neogobius melanostomus TaxID=47308 RepID=A0A8C6SSS1_9GOBI
MLSGGGSVPPLGSEQEASPNKQHTGAAFCQLMHILFPPLIDLSRVQFHCADPEDRRHNYSLLQRAFDEVGVCRYIPVNEFIKKKEAELGFLQWFRAFFEKNKGRRYNFFASSQWPNTTTVASNIKDDPHCPVEPENDKEILKLDILKTNEVLPNEDKRRDLIIKPEPNLDEDTLNRLNKPENKPLQVLPVVKTEKWREDSLHVNHSHLQSTKDEINVHNPPLVSLPPQLEPINLNNHINVPQVHNAERIKKDNLGQNNVTVTIANEKKCAEQTPKKDNYFRSCANPQIADMGNCNVNTNTDILTVSTNSFNQVHSQPLNSVNQPAPMSTMNTNDVILISDTEEGPPEALKTIADNGDHKPPVSPGTPSKSALLKELCSQTPYCVYVDMGMELDQTGCTVLIGFFDRVSGVSIVQKLDTLSIDQLSNGKQAPILITKHTANAAADLLIALLKKYELPQESLKVFYCNIPDPEVNRIIVAKLKELSPHVASLGGLACMVGGACQTGLLECYSHVLDLINDIHYFRLPERLTEANYNILIPISLQYAAIIAVIQYMSHNWQKLEDYFKALKSDVGASRLLRILDKFQEHKVRLDFIFLSHALDTFQSFQDLQKSKTRDMVMDLQLTAMLVNAYASSIFTPAAADQFVRKKDMQMLLSKQDLLPISCVNVGIRARRCLSSLSFAELGEEDRSTFLSKALLFYQTTLKMLVESLPGQLSPVSMKSIGTLLKHPHSLKSRTISTVQLVELGCQLGVCKTESSNSQLASEYVNYIQKANDWRDSLEGEPVGLRWLKVLDCLRKFPLLFKLVLTLLAFPRSLQLKHIFQSQWRAGSPKHSAHRNGMKKGYLLHRPEREMETENSSSDEDRTPPHRPRLFAVRPGPKRLMDSEDTDYTDNSSDVVDVTEDYKLTVTPKEAQPKGVTPSTVSNDIAPAAEKPVVESVLVLNEEEDQPKVKKPTVKATNPTPARRQQGELVLINLEESVSWPAVTVPSLEDNQEPDMKKVEWYGHSMTSEVCVEYLRPFADFAKYFSQNTFATVAMYKEAVFLALREASARCQREFLATIDSKEEILIEMLDWAFGGFKPMGPQGFAPAVLDEIKSATGQGKIRPEDLPKVSVSLYKLPVEMPKKVHVADSSEKAMKKKSKTAWKGKGPKRKTTLLQDFFEDNDMSPDFVPHKKRPYTKVDHSNKGRTGSVYKQPDQKQRERIIRRILAFDLDIEEYCLCCGTKDTVMSHPLFKGSLCLECKNNFTETLYRYDEDGYQSYCTICCYGMEVILCGNDSCCRSYCADCLNILVSDRTFDFLKDLDPWICYLCQAEQTHGALTPRQDWSIRVQELFANNSAMEFEPHRVYPSISANLRRPVRVLSLFDGIATGYLVLKDLGFKVETYVASEVCEDSIAVAHINHDGKIIHVGDARLITQEHLDKWGPFDLLIGGSPCNDLSIVNPLRKGLYEGTGRLFFEYYRILQLLKPKEEDPRPFFWLFENVVFMNVHDRLNICRFLECNPVLVDAVRVSPANRSRYFWGNIPGMNRPIAASQTDKLNLQDCLEIGRVARMTKVRTITTNSNSLKQGKNVSMLPVLQNGTEDTLWITEIEKIFGFPKHYTDVRNMNRQQRQKVLGKAWSVPVIRHLFAPLKDYFACEELPQLSTSNASNTSTSGVSGASTSSCSPCGSPATPEMHQLR